MASTKPAFMAVAVLLLHASWCAVARQHYDPEPCGDPQDCPADPAEMLVTSFEEGGDGGGPSACDGKYHSNEGLLAALSTEWYAGGARCNKHIRIITTQSDLTVVAEVVDEVDGFNHTVATSKAVWDAFGLDTNIGEVSIYSG